jgi:hypothetical protein
MLQIQSVILLEKYYDDDQKSEESQFAQFTVSWIEKTNLLGMVKLKSGWNETWSESNSTTGEVSRDETDLFLTGSTFFSLIKNTNLGFELEIKDRKYHEKPIGDDYDEDATVVDMSGELSLSLNDFFSGSLELKTQNVDADGQYMDNTSSILDFQLKYKWDKLALSESVKYRIQNYERNNPLYNEIVKNTKIQIDIKSVWTLSKGTAISAKYSYEKQISNVDSKEYQNNTIGVSLTYVFR